MNLYLYIPPHSAHQPGIVKSLVFGQLQRYWLQNSSTENYKYFSSLLFQRLLDRGHTAKDLTPIFCKLLKNWTTQILINFKKRKKDQTMTPFISIPNITQMGSLQKESIKSSKNTVQKSKNP